MKQILLFLLFCCAAVHLYSQNTFSVNGVFLAPPGTKIILQNNNTDNLSLLAKKDAVDASADAFKFLKPPSPGLDSKITNGNGLLPITGNGVKVEGDCQFDLVSRSKVFGTCTKLDTRFLTSGIFSAYTAIWEQGLINK